MLRDKLRPASFRGVGFFVDSDELSGGRRIQTHEYPQRDRPYTEDLGRKARQVSFTAFLIGPDCATQRDRLLTALEGSGAGQLVHPHWGSLTVNVSEYRVSHADSEHGIARFQLSFVEAGDLSFPVATPDTRYAAAVQADAVDGAAAADYQRAVSLDGRPDWVVSGVLSDLEAGLTAVENAVDFLRDPLGALRADLSGLIGRPLALASRVQALFSHPGGGSGRARALAGLGGGYASSRPVRLTTPSRRAEAANQAAVDGLIRRAALAGSVRAAALSDYLLRDDALATRESIVAAVAAEELRTADDAVYRSLVDSRVAVARDITARAAPLPQLRTVTPPGPVPSLALVYDLYEDTGREADVVTRNGVIHPGFVPRHPLRVPTK